MKTTFISLCLLCSAMGGQAQNGDFVGMHMKNLENPHSDNDSIDCSRFVAVYDYTVNTLTAEGEKTATTVQTILQVGDHASKFQPYDQYRRERGDSYRNMGYSHNFKYNITVQSVPTVLIDREAEEMTVIDYLAPHKYVMLDEYKGIKWKITDDTITIKNYLCRRAEVKYRGREWTAWFTEEIPTSAGPWKLGGLPGLILKATDSHGIFTFDINGIENTASAIRFTKDIKAIKLDLDRFIKTRNKTLTDKRYPDNPKYYIGESVGARMVYNTYEGEGTQQYEFVNDVYIPAKANVYQPLELK